MSTERKHKLVREVQKDLSVQDALMPLDGMCKNVFLYVWVKSGEDAPRLMGRKMRMQFFTGQPWWRGEASLGCLVPWTGVPNVSITDAAPTLKYPAVSQLFRCQPNYR